ncbi:hypothetical protein Tsubulata_024892, partial [Turnera subulata]
HQTNPKSHSALFKLATTTVFFKLLSLDSPIATVLPLFLFLFLFPALCHKSQPVFSSPSCSCLVADKEQRSIIDSLAPSLRPASAGRRRHHHPLFLPLLFLPPHPGFRSSATSSHDADSLSSCAFPQSRFSRFLLQSMATLLV